MSAPPPPYPSNDQNDYPPHNTNPGYPPQPNAYDREAHYRSIIQKYEISEDFGKRMQMLQGN